MHPRSRHTAALHRPVPPVGRRIAVILYVCAYVALIVLSIGVAQTIGQYFSTPDPQASYVTCKSGVKVPYKLLGIRNPSTDPAHDDLLIDAACRNLGGNSYTNVMRPGPKTSPWEYGLAAFAAGVIVLELLKGALVYLVRGYFPGFGTLSRR
jgi:hypothetical protein